MGVINSRSDNNRPLGKLPVGDEVLGASGAQARSVFNIHEDLSTKATTQFAPIGLFPKRSKVKTQKHASYNSIEKKRLYSVLLLLLIRPANLLIATIFNVFVSFHTFTAGYFSGPFTGPEEDCCD